MLIILIWNLFGICKMWVEIGITKPVSFRFVAVRVCGLLLLFIKGIFIQRIVQRNLLFNA